MYTLDYSTQFKKDFKKITRKPTPYIIEIGNVISELQKGRTLEAKYVDHPLSGNWGGFRDCHIKPDLVLIYRIHENTLQLARIGSHNDVF
ncbi:MAG: type II toxin-antitoxin system YafQ family toxin [Sedimenticola sp.]